jgi:hypothetical protein
VAFATSAAHFYWTFSGGCEDRPFEGIAPKRTPSEMEKAGGQLGPGPPAFSRVRPQGLAEEAPESASSDPTRGPSGEALADPAVLDGLVVAEEPGEGVEQAARAGDGHGSTFSIATKPEIQRNRRGRCDRSRRDAANEAVGRIEGGQERRHGDDNGEGRE